MPPVRAVPTSAGSRVAHARRAFDFELPEERIALRPARPRDASRLLVVRPDGRRSRTAPCATCPTAAAGRRLWCFNDTQVIPARLHGVRDARARRGAHRGDAAPARWAPSAGAPSRGPASGLRGRRPHRASARRRRACLLGGSTRGRGKGEDGEVAARLRPRRRRRSTRRSRRSARCRCRPTSPPAAPRTQRDRERLPDRLRRPRRARSRRRPPALHFDAGAARRARGRAASRQTRLTLHVGAGTFLPVKAEDIDRRTACTPNGARSAAETAGGAQRGARRRPARHRRSAPPRCALLETAAADDGAHRALRRRDRHLHHARLPLPRRRRADDQLPPAEVDAVHAGLGLRGPRHDERRLRPRHRARATASIPTATPACCSASPDVLAERQPACSMRASHSLLRRPTARRAPACSGRRAATSARRPSCRSAPPAR